MIHFPFELRAPTESNNAIIIKVLHPPASAKATPRELAGQPVPEDCSANCLPPGRSSPHKHEVLQPQPAHPLPWRELRPFGLSQSPPRQIFRSLLSPLVVWLPRLGATASSNSQLQAFRQIPLKCQPLSKIWTGIALVDRKPSDVTCPAQPPNEASDLWQPLQLQSYFPPYRVHSQASHTTKSIFLCNWVFVFPYFQLHLPFPIFHIVFPVMSWSLHEKKHLLLPGKIEQTHLVITIKQICCPMVIISITRTIHRPVTSNTKAMDPPATQQAPDEQ